METPNVWSMEPLESAGHSAGRAPWPRPRSAAAVVGTSGRASSEDRGQPHRWGSVGRREERLAAGACQGGITRWCPDPSSTGRCGAGGRLTPARMGDQGGRHIRIQEGLGQRPGSVWWEVTERLGAFSTAPRLHPPHLGWCRPGRQGRWQRVGEDAEAEVMPAAGMEGPPRQEGTCRVWLLGEERRPAKRPPRCRPGGSRGRVGRGGRGHLSGGVTHAGRWVKRRPPGSRGHRPAWPPRRELRGVWEGCAAGQTDA